MLLYISLAKQIF